jgi:hypothetical protein
VVASFNEYTNIFKRLQPMQISTQLLIDTVASMSEGLKPSEKTLNMVKEFAYTYRVKDGQAFCLN